MAAELFYELVGSSDSEDEGFEGFDINNKTNAELQNVDPDDIELDEMTLDEHWEEVEQEHYQEERDPKIDAYSHEWLKDFTANSGPKTSMPMQPLMKYLLNL